jgi:hypothetical protein
MKTRKISNPGELLSTLKASMDWDTKAIDVDDNDTRLILKRQYKIPDGLGINTVEWEIDDKKKDIHIVKLGTHTYIFRQIGEGKLKREYFCCEHHTKEEHLDHVSAPITVKYHILNYLNRTDSPKAVGP